MKKICFLIILSAFLMFSGCTGSNKIISSCYDDKFHLYEDYNFTQFGPDVFNSTIAQSPNGIYYIVGNYLFFYDFETKKSAPLCFKSDCIHFDENDAARTAYCDAHIGSSLEPLFVAYFKDKLYCNYLDRGSKKQGIMEMNVDGSRRKMLLELDDTSNVCSIVMHRGVIYYSKDYKDADGNQSYGLYAFSVLSGKKNSICIYEGKYPKSDIHSLDAILPYGKYVYFSDMGCEDSEDIVHDKLLRYDIETGIVSDLADGFSMRGISDDSLILMRDIFYRYDLSTQKITKSDGSYTIYKQKHPEEFFDLILSYDGYSFIHTLGRENSDGMDENVAVIDGNGNIVCTLPGTGLFECRAIVEYGEDTYWFRFVNGLPYWVDVGELGKNTVSQEPLLPSFDVGQFYKPISY